jgi:hypothetical protein
MLPHAADVCHSRELVPCSIHTSYVTVEPKRRKQTPQQSSETASSPPYQPQHAPLSQQPPRPMMPYMYGPPFDAHQQQSATSAISYTSQFPPQQYHSGYHPPPPPRSPLPGRGASASAAPERQLRRARIVITVQRTENYKRWLADNPLHALGAGDDEDDENVADDVVGQDLVGDSLPPPSDPTEPPSGASPLARGGGGVRASVSMTEGRDSGYAIAFDASLI